MRGSWFDGTVLCEQSQLGDNGGYGDPSTLSTPYNASPRSSMSSIPEPGSVRGMLTNETEASGHVSYRAQAFRAKVVHSTPHFPSVAHKSTRWTAGAVTPHPIVLSYTSWRSAQRTWISSVSVHSVRHPRSLLYRHIEPLGLVVGLRDQEGDIQYQPALVVLGGAARDPLLEEFITPGVHLQESDELQVVIQWKKNHLNDESEMVDFLLVHKPGRKFGGSTTGLCTESATEREHSVIVPTNLKFCSRNKHSSPLFSESGRHVVIKGRMLQSVCRVKT